LNDLYNFPGSEINDLPLIEEKSEHNINPTEDGSKSLQQNAPTRSNGNVIKPDTQRELPNDAPEDIHNASESKTTVLSKSDAEPQEPLDIGEITVKESRPPIPDSEHNLDEEPPPEEETKPEEVEDAPADGTSHVSDNTTLYENIKNEVDALQNASDRHFNADRHFNLHRGPTNDEDERMDQFDKTIDSVDSEWKPDAVPDRDISPTGHSTTSWIKVRPKYIIIILYLHQKYLLYHNILIICPIRAMIER
jgi:hypothetical protein